MPPESDVKRTMGFHVLINRLGSQPIRQLDAREQRFVDTFQHFQARFTYSSQAFRGNVQKRKRFRCCYQSLSTNI